MHISLTPLVPSSCYMFLSFQVTELLLCVLQNISGTKLRYVTIATDTLELHESSSINAANTVSVLLSTLPTTAISTATRNGGSARHRALKLAIAMNIDDASRVKSMTVVSDVYAVTLTVRLRAHTAGVLAYHSILGKCSLHPTYFVLTLLQVLCFPRYSAVPIVGTPCSPDRGTLCSPYPRYSVLTPS